MERRANPRTHFAADARSAARLRPGRDLVIIDISRGGAFVEASCRLLPGTPVEMQLTLAEERLFVKGRVVRCHVSALDPERGVRYRGAIAFVERIELSTALLAEESSPREAVEGNGYPIPTAPLAATEPCGQPLPCVVASSERFAAHVAVKAPAPKEGSVASSLVTFQSFLAGAT